jgi:hypothetical protein
LTIGGSSCEKTLPNIMNNRIVIFVFKRDAVFRLRNADDEKTPLYKLKQ